MSAPGNAISSEVLPARLPVLGAVKIGGLEPKKRESRSGGEWQAPVKFDCFKIVTRTRGGDGNFIVDQAIHDIIGQEPTELDVRLPYDTRAQNLYTQMTHYSGQTCVRKCDGEEWVDPRTDVGGTCEMRKGQACPCKPYARLSVILEAAPTYGGIHVYRTTSKEATASMQTLLRQLEHELGSLRGLPMKMVLYPAEVSFQDSKGTWKKGTAHKVALVLRASFEEARAAALQFHRTNQLTRREVLQLSAGTSEELDEWDDEDEAHIGAEFFPPSEQGSPTPTDKSPLAKMNEAVLGGPGTEKPDAAAHSVDDLVAEIRKLLGEAEDRGVKLNDGHLKSFEAAIQSRDEGQLRAGIQWLERQFERAVATDEELKELERWEHVAHERGRVTEDERASIAQAAATSAGPVVRQWTRALQQRVREEADQETTDETTETTEASGEQQGGLFPGEG